MSGKFNLKSLKKPRTLLEPKEAENVLMDSPDIEPQKVTTKQTVPQYQPNTKTMPKRGRPATGKRSDPDYVGALAYIRKETYEEVRNRLFLQRREYSDLIQELLDKWLKVDI